VCRCAAHSQHHPARLDPAALRSNFSSSRLFSACMDPQTAKLPLLAPPSDLGVTTPLPSCGRCARGGVGDGLKPAVRRARGGGGASARGGGCRAGDGGTARRAGEGARQRRAGLGRGLVADYFGDGRSRSEMLIQRLRSHDGRHTITYSAFL
jgi:hypothetical protein